MWDQRTRLLVGDEGVARLRAAHVAVYGLGGVGSYAAEVLARAGVGRLTLVDRDVVEETNINRQLVALRGTVGRPKVEVARDRFLDINPDAHVTALHVAVGPETMARVVPEGLGFAIDAIDDVNAKVDLLLALKQQNVTTVSCMGAARRLRGSALVVDDIGRTQGCPLARAVRLRLRKHGVADGIRCIYFREPALPASPAGKAGTVRAPQGTIAHVPALMGLSAAGLIIEDILGGRGLAP